MNAVTPGFEKTFFGGMMSFEMRLPMASTLSSNVYLDGTSSTGVGEIGDLSMALKCLLIQWDGVYVSGGLAMTVPTAKDSQYFLSQATTPADIIVRNQSVHLMPFRRVAMDQLPMVRHRVFPNRRGCQRRRG